MWDTRFDNRVMQRPSAYQGSPFADEGRVRICSRDAEVRAARNCRQKRYSERILIISAERTYNERARMPPSISSETIPKELGRLTVLLELSLYGNQLTGERKIVVTKLSMLRQRLKLES